MLLFFSIDDSSRCYESVSIRWKHVFTSDRVRDQG